MELKPSFLSSLMPVKENFIVWLVIIVSCIPFLILNRYNLNAISHWFMPVRFEELITPFAIWRLWTPTFIHYTPAHLIPNLFLWWWFASKIEKESRVQLLVVTLVSAAGANMSQWWFVDANFGGLSGVVYALMSYLWVLGRYGGKLNYQFDSLLAVLMLLLIPLSFTGAFGRFASFAHLGGLLCGILLAFSYLLIIGKDSAKITRRSENARSEPDQK